MLDINYNTEIDTVALQLDFDSAEEQKNEFDQLGDWIIAKRLGLLKFDTNKTSKIRVHELYSGKSIIATFSTGATTKKDDYNRGIIKYYIRIRIAGLKSYNIVADSASSSTLVTICAYLNAAGKSYRFVELDVCLDIFCSFKNILAVCTQRTARTSYNDIGNLYKNSTSYIEYFQDAYTRKQATKRAYLYDKQTKEGLAFNVTRFEIKLQNGWFLNNELNVESIINTINRYHVMYYKNIRNKKSKINHYNSYANVTAREIRQLEFEKYRLYPNQNIIKEFIRQIQSVYIDHYENIVIPTLYPKNNFIKDFT